MNPTVAVDARRKRQGKLEGEATLRALLQQVEHSPAAFFAANSKSFSFAARFFPPEARAQVAQVYAFCRVTDDLADGAIVQDAAAADDLLQTWQTVARRAYRGEPSGIGFLDTIMRSSAAAGVPFDVVGELVDGVRSDLGRVAVQDWAQLHRYCYQVAGVIGVWLTRLFGIHDPWVLDRAEGLGHALQLTNILRDVGEDLAMDRVYLPRSVLNRHGVGRSDLDAMAAGAPITDAYRAVVDSVARVADHHYRLAFEAMPHLPAFYARPVAVAAEVYHGIHDRIRAAGYDNLRRRARTSAADKAVLAGRGLWRLGRMGRTTDRSRPIPVWSRPLAAAVEVGARGQDVALAQLAPRWRSHG